MLHQRKRRDTSDYIVIFGLVVVSLPSITNAQGDTTSDFNSFTTTQVIPKEYDEFTSIGGAIKVRGWFAIVTGVSMGVAGGYLWVTLGKCFWPIQQDKCSSGSSGVLASVMLGALGSAMLVSGIALTVLGVRLLMREYRMNFRIPMPVVDTEDERLYVGFQLFL